MRYLRCRVEMYCAVEDDSPVTVHSVALGYDLLKVDGVLYFPTISWLKDSKSGCVPVDLNMGVFSEDLVELFEVSDITKEVYDKSIAD